MINRPLLSPIKLIQLVVDAYKCTGSERSKVCMLEHGDIISTNMQYQRQDPHIQSPVKDSDIYLHKMCNDSII